MIPVCIYAAVDSFLMLVVYVPVPMGVIWLAGMRPIAGDGILLCLLAWLCVACQSPLTTFPGASPPTATLTPVETRMPTPAPGPLTEAEAIALVKEEMAARGVALHTVRITIGGEPRWASVRYASSYAVEGRVFQAQTVLVALAVARVMAQVHPPIDGGIRLAVIPGGESDVGLRVTVVDGPTLEAWADGSISDQEFVDAWTVGTVTTE